MSEAARARIHREFEIPGVEHISTATTLRPGSRAYIVDSGGGAVAVTLPSIGESVGNIISFQAPKGTTFPVTVLLDEGISTLLTFSTDDKYAVIFNNGLQWLTLISN